MLSVADIFETFGGPAALGRIIGKRASTASEMKRRRSIPTKYWIAIIEEGKNQGLDITEAVILAAHNVNHVTLNANMESRTSANSAPPEVAP